jgi:DNA (cytosine-5)-methyltransferase 1
MDCLPPREWGTEAYERMLRRGDPNGTRRAGSGNLREQVREPLTWSTPRHEGFDAGGGRRHASLPQEAKAWPTPQAFDSIDIVRHPDERSDEANAGGCSNLREAVHWPTPTKDDGDNWTRDSGTIASLVRDARQSQPNPDNASLNPDWVDCLMGYPVGYSAPEGIPMGDRMDEFYSAGCPWPMPRGAEQHDWEPPRLTLVREHRSPRLKADGNSIVPQVARLWLKAAQDEGGL